MIPTATALDDEQLPPKDRTEVLPSDTGIMQTEIRLSNVPCTVSIGRAAAVSAGGLAGSA